MTLRALSGAELDQLTEEQARIVASFQAAGALRVEPPALLPASTLLDLYGEDIRARAFVTSDGHVEHMLRPDFTVPVVQQHMEVGAEPARYAYCGPVWRRQNSGITTALEFTQAGFELFDGKDVAAADAEVFALIRNNVANAGLSVATGDIGILLAAIDGLSTTAARRNALRRHAWRPARFHRLLVRFSTKGSTKGDLLDAARGGRVEQLIADAGTHVGLRSVDDIVTRIDRLVEEDDTAPIPQSEIDLLAAILNLSGSCVEVLGSLRALAANAPFLLDASERFAKRLAALSAVGIDPADLPFEGSYGRTSMEYYDGFVFGFFAADRPDLPVIASGGRYDALTRVLGGGRGIPAAGGIIRPQALLALKEGTC